MKWISEDKMEVFNLKKIPLVEVLKRLVKFIISIFNIEVSTK